MWINPQTSQVVRVFEILKNSFLVSNLIRKNAHTPLLLAMPLKVFVIFISFANSLFALDYGIFAKNDNIENISKFFVIGERCSGTNYLDCLILNNTSLKNSPLGHKHFPPWYNLGQENYQGDPRYYHFEGTENHLFIVIFRNPYDWLRSFHLKPWHSKKYLKNLRFSKFIRSTWEVEMDKFLIDEMPINPYLDLTANGTPFENVIALRIAKIENMLEIKNRASNVIYVNYETIRDYPEEFLNEISTLYSIQLKTPFSPIDKYKTTKNEYKPKKYAPISTDDMEYINSHLNEKLENEIGYEIRCDL